MVTPHVKVHRTIIRFTVRAIFASSRIECYVKKIDGLKVGFDSNSKSVLIENMSDMLSSGVRGVSGSTSNGESVIPLQSDGVVPDELSQFVKKKNANQLTYFSAVKATHGYVEKFVLITFYLCATFKK